MKKQKEKGITLISLVVTIIVILILAGISIMMLTGENSLINQAKNAKVITGKAQIDEAVKLAYASASIDKYTNDNAITLGKIAEELRKDGYEIETRSSSGSSEVTSIEINPTSVTLAPGGNATIEVMLQQEAGADSKYYVKKDGKYYEFVIENDEVKVLEPVTNIDGAGGENKIQVSSSDENIVKAELNEETRIITLTAKSNSGSAEITVKYGEEYTETCNVKIQVKPTESSVADANTSIVTGYGTIDVVFLSGNTNTPTTTPNSPESHLSGMTGVYWNGTTETTVSSSNKSNWYSYTAGTGTTENTSSKWANAKNTDGSYFVWIPRYAYRITYYASQDAWKNGAEPTGYYDGYGMWKAETGELKYKLESGIQPIEYNGEKYILHPAFMGTGSEDLGGGFGTDEKGIEGFWVAKYEMSNSSSKPVSKPGESSWRYITIGDCYTKSLNYDIAKESHLMKNSEWGAVAYLTHSQYGRNGYEIDINNSSSYITGNGGGSTNASYASGTTNAYNTETGVKSSSTGNIHGIYDLSGGAYEYVASYDSLGNISYVAGSYFGLDMTKNAKDSDGNYISTKYITKYSNGTSTNAGTLIYTVGKTGDATEEVYAGSSGWFADDSIFVVSDYPFFVRGGNFYNGSDTGVFYSNIYAGNSSNDGSFRVVLAP